MNYNRYSAIWPLIHVDASISDQLHKLYLGLFDSLNRTMCGGDMSPILGFWGKAPVAERFPGYYRGLRERWVRKSGCYFFCHTPKIGGYGTPRSKMWGVRMPPVSYAYVGHYYPVHLSSSLG